jgi:hypothetical protein
MVKADSLNGTSSKFPGLSHVQNPSLRFGIESNHRQTSDHKNFLSPLLPKGTCMKSFDFPDGSDADGTYKSVFLFFPQASFSGGHVRS